MLRARRGDAEPVTLRPERSFFPSSDPTLGAVSRYFEGEATSEVGMDTGLRRDLWTVVSPDIVNLLGIARRGDRVFARARSLPLAERQAALGEALRRLVDLYANRAAPLRVRVLVSPMVTWIWLGAAVVFAGGLIALWPAPFGARRLAPTPAREGGARAQPRLSRPARRGWTCCSCSWCWRSPCS